MKVRHRFARAAAPAAGAILAITAGAANAGMDLWHWETVTLNPGESYHFHYEQLQLIGSWTSLWIEWETPGTAHVELETMGQLHLNPGDSAHVDIHGTVPFMDWETFTNIGDGPQTLHGQTVVDGVQSQPFWFETFPGDAVDIHLESTTPDPASGLFSAQKWFTNETPAGTPPTPQWWDYQSTTQAWVDFVATDSLHLESHFEQLFFTGAWLWIENGSTGAPITFTVHFHVPTPATGGLFSIAGLALLRRRRGV